MDLDGDRSQVNSNLVNRFKLELKKASENVHKQFQSSLEYLKDRLDILLEEHAILTILVAELATCNELEKGDKERRIRELQDKINDNYLEVVVFKTTLGVYCNVMGYVQGCVNHTYRDTDQQ